MLDSRIEKATVQRLRAKLHHPFRIATGQHDSLENLLFSLQLRDGTWGYGEAAIATHITGETLDATAQNLKRIGRISGDIG